MLNILHINRIRHELTQLQTQVPNEFDTLRRDCAALAQSLSEMRSSWDGTAERLDALSQRVEALAALDDSLKRSVVFGLQGLEQRLDQVVFDARVARDAGPDTTVPSACPSSLLAEFLAFQDRHAGSRSARAGASTADLLAGVARSRPDGDLFDAAEVPDVLPALRARSGGTLSAVALAGRPIPITTLNDLLGLFQAARTALANGGVLLVDPACLRPVVPGGLGLCLENTAFDVPTLLRFFDFESIEGPAGVVCAMKPAGKPQS